MRNLTEQDVTKIREYLLKNSTYLWQAHNWCRTLDDVQKFGNRNHEAVIDNGDLFLVDILANELWICELTKKKYRLRDGRRVSCRPRFQISDNMRRDYGNCFNGYANIPTDCLKTEED